MTDFSLVAAGVMAVAPQPASDVSALGSPELQTQEEELITTVLQAPVAPEQFHRPLAPKSQPMQPDPMQPGHTIRPVATTPQFSSSPHIRATAGNANAQPKVTRRAQVEARLRQLENSALAQAPGAVVSFELSPTSWVQPTVPPQPVPPQPVPSPQANPLRQAPQPLLPRHRMVFAPPPVAFAPVSSTAAGGSTYSYPTSLGQMGVRVWNTRIRYSAH